MVLGRGCTAQLHRVGVTVRDNLRHFAAFRRCERPDVCRDPL